jgi:hypothetical protein
MQNGTLGWGNIYGPSGGQAVSQSTSVSMGGGPLDRLPIAPLTLLALGILAWWALEKWD